MAGVFKTVGSALTAVDTVAASGARRLAVWARESEAKTKYRSVAQMSRIKREAASELAAEVTAMEDAIREPAFVKALQILDAMDTAENQD